MKKFDVMANIWGTVCVVEELNRIYNEEGIQSILPNKEINRQKCWCSSQISWVWAARVMTLKKGAPPVLHNNKKNQHQ